MNVLDDNNSLSVTLIYEYFSFLRIQTIKFAVFPRSKLNGPEMAESKKTMQLELLMEKLRHRTSHINLTESAKTFRMTILVRSFPYIDPVTLISSCWSSCRRSGTETM